MNGETKQGVRWQLDSFGNIELDHRNEQSLAVLTVQDIENFLSVIIKWKEAKGELVPEALK